MNEMNVSANDGPYVYENRGSSPDLGLLLASPVTAPM